MCITNTSAELNWALVRNYNAHMVKRNGVVFSTEAGNLACKHSYKYSALNTPSVIKIEAVSAGVSVSLRSRKAPQGAIQSAFGAPSVIKKGKSPAHRAVRLGRLLQANGYRSDLIRPAQARLCALLASQKPRFPKRASKKQL